MLRAIRRAPASSAAPAGPAAAKSSSAGSVASPVRLRAGPKRARRRRTWAAQRARRRGTRPGRAKRASPRAAARVQASRHARRGRGLGATHPAVEPDLRLQLRQALHEPVAPRAQRGQQPAELGLERVELGQHPVGGLLDAGDVVGRILTRLGTHLGGPMLGGLEDQADLLGRLGRKRGRGGVHARLELVGHAAQVLVDRRGVVAAATRREVPALDAFAIHDR